MRASNLRFRDYAPDDLDALFRLDQVCFDPPFRFSRAEMHRLVASVGVRFVIAESNDVLVGFAMVHLRSTAGGCIGYLTTIDVHPSVRRRGIARKLLRAAEQQVKCAGCAEMQLHVFAGNIGAIKLYTSEGYSVLRSEQSFYGPALDAYIYSKSLLS